ncbi:MAG: potassium channel protein [Deltaproteobacteria bacterium]|nr:potassium channel protein [Deltaproteobacteria bacterium]
MPWGALVAVVLAGTVGYRVFERLSWTDAVYLAVVTISTVGYGDIVPRTPVGRLFTVFLILSGVGVALYLLGSLAELVLEGRLRELLGRGAMEREIGKLNGHVIVCGYGRFGKAVADELARSRTDVVVIDVDPQSEEDLKRAALPYLIGSALSDEVLSRAGVARARAIVVATASDSDNVFITLSAREQNPSIRIHSRAETEAGIRRLRLAGADQVISAYQTGGTRIAASILRPAVVDFLEISSPARGEEVAIEEIRISPGSGLEGRAIRAIEHDHPRLRVVAIKRGEEPIRIVPDPSTQVGGGDFLVVVGERQGLEQLAQMAGRA